MKLYRIAMDFSGVESYMDIGHFGENNEAWVIVNDDLIVEKAGIENGPFMCDLHQRYDKQSWANGRIDHAKKVISIYFNKTGEIVSNEERINYLRRLFKMDYTGYRLFLLDGKNWREI